MNFLQKFRDIIASPTHLRTTGILVVLILLAAIPLTVIVSQQQQDIRQRASGIDVLNVRPKFCNSISASNSPAECLLKEKINNDNFYGLCDLSKTCEDPSLLSRLQSLIPNKSYYEGYSCYPGKKVKVGEKCTAFDNDGNIISGTCAENASNEGVCVPSENQPQPQESPTPTIAPISYTETPTPAPCTGDSSFDLASCLTPTKAPTPTPAPTTVGGTTPAISITDTGVCIYKSAVDELKQAYIFKTGSPPPTLLEVNILASAYKLSQNSCRE